MDLIRPGSRGEAVRDVQHRPLAAGFHVDAERFDRGGWIKRTFDKMEKRRSG